MIDENWDIDPQLRECATKFIQLFSPSFTTNERITEIRCGYKNIGILIVTSDKYYIINSKDKTGLRNKQRGEQIKTLINEGIPENCIKYVCYEIVEQCNNDCDYDYKITRKDLLKVIETYRSLIKNCIFCDYYDYLKHIDDEVESYRYLPIDEWNDNAYSGFFDHIIRENLIPYRFENLYYIHKPTGSYQTLLWHIFTNEQIKNAEKQEKYFEDLYLQIDQNNIIVKMIKEVYAERARTQDLRKQIYNSLYSSIGESFKKKNINSSKWMCIGYIQFDEGNYKEIISMMVDGLDGLINRI